jgi:hypothetical protein
MNRQRTVLVLLLCSTGCIWRSYGTIMSVHVDVLTQTAAKLFAVVESGRGLTAEGMAEYVYPAQRGREFLRQFDGYSGRRSYQKFAAFLGRYEAMVRDVDAQRAARPDGRIDLAKLKADNDALDRLAADIRGLLAKGD